MQTDQRKGGEPKSSEPKSDKPQEKPAEKPGVKEQRDAARQQPQSPGEPATGE
jgi:hypothetical protein